jgi:hypothetical protein
MATQQIVQRKMQVTLKSAAPATDRYTGKAQWELRVQDPFSKYPEYETKYYIPAVGDEPPPPPRVYWVILTQHDLKINKTPPKDGGPIEPYNGLYDWMWRWKIDNRDHFHCPDAPEPEFQENVVQPTSMAIPVGATAVNGVGTPYTPPANPTTSERQSVFNAAVALTVATDLVDKERDIILERVRDLAGDLWTILQNIGSEAPVAPESVVVEEFDDEQPPPW